MRSKISGSFQLGVLLLAVLCAKAQSDTDFVEHRWTKSDGLPSDGINALEITADGFLWLATFNGLVRFDGRHFEVFNRALEPALPESRFVDVAQSQGYLWATTESRRLVRYAPDSGFETLTTAHGLPDDQVRCVVDSDQGTLIGTFRGAVRLTRAGEIKPLSPGLAANITAMSPRRDGSVVAGTLSRGAWILRTDAEAYPLDTGPITSITSVAADDDYIVVGGKTGAALLTASGDLLDTIVRPDATNLGTHVFFGPGPQAYLDQDAIRWRGGRAEHSSDLLQVPIHRGTLFVKDPDGNHWQSDLTHLEKNGSTVYASPEGDRITDFALDPTGQVWIALANEGLTRLRANRLSTITHSDGLDPANVYSVLADRGSMLVGSYEAGFQSVNPRDGTVQTVHTGREFLAGLRDSTGEIWMAGSSVCKGSEVASCNDVPWADQLSGQTVRALFEDSKGRLFFGVDRGVFVLQTDGSLQFRDHRGGLTYAPVRAALEVPSGYIWFATNGAGVQIYGEDHFESSIDSTAGLSSNRIRSLHFDRTSESVLIGTEDGGLCRAHLATRPVVTEPCLGPQHGLPDYAIHRILEDADGRIWISTNRGVMWLDAAALSKTFQGTRHFVAGQIIRNSMPDFEANGGVMDSGAIDDTGTIWFPTQAGLVGAGPSTVFPEVLPDVIVRYYATRTQRVSRPEEVHLGAEERRVDIRVDVPVLAPGLEQVRTRYRLSGGENDEWKFADSHGSFALEGQQPGEYALLVQASSTHGRWNTSVVTLPVVIEPGLLETTWFRTLVGISLLALLFGIGQWRTSRIRHRQKILERLVTQKTEEIRKQKEAVEAVNAARARLFATISHELRTPLSLILAPLEDAQRNRTSLRISQDDSMLRNARRLRTMVDQILDLERLESGHLKLDLEPVELAEAVRAICEPFSSLARTRNIDWQLAISEPLPIHADRTQLEKILNNLCSNALKFTPAGGSVSITASMQGEEAVVRVEDSGPGIPASMRQEAMTRFSRLKRDAHIEGTGIGLSIVRELTEMHGGQFSIGSSGLGGAAMVIAFSLSHSSNADSFDSAAANIIVVDDSKDMRAYLRSILEERYRVIEAGSGEEGLDKIATALPDVIVSDVMMPGIGGLEMVRRVRSGGDESSIPVLFLTARGGPTDEIEALANGCDSYLAKPFHSGVLIARIQALLDFRSRVDNVDRAALEPSPETFQTAIENDVNRVLHEHFSDCDLSVDSMAGMLSMSRASLFRKLKDATGKSPTDYIRNFRLDAARSLLRKTQSPVSDIAYACGFSTLAAFGRSFRERFGTTATEYRDSHATTNVSDGGEAA